MADPVCHYNLGANLGGLVLWERRNSTRWMVWRNSCLPGIRRASFSGYLTDIVACLEFIHMTAIDLDKLEALAKAATPGPWRLSEKEIIVYSADEQHGYNVHDMKGGGHEGMLENHKKDAAFIAAANPSAVLALIARVRELETELDFLFSTGNRTGESPRILDMIYTVFMHSGEPNKEDGGPKDWMNDTKPEAEEVIKQARATLERINKHLEG
jgi:hypothetical protein